MENITPSHRSPTKELKLINTEPMQINRIRGLIPVVRWANGSLLGVCGIFTVYEAALF